VELDEGLLQFQLLLLLLFALFVTLGLAHRGLMPAANAAADAGAASAAICVVQPVSVMEARLSW